MIIPIRCMNCGKLLADKWEYYQEQLREMLGPDFAKRTVFDGTPMPETAEHKIMVMLGLDRYCCKKALLTHVDLIARFT